MYEKLITQKQSEVELLQKNSITSLARKIIGDREEEIDKEREDYEKISKRHIELFKSIELIRFELEILNNKIALVEGVETKAALLFKERERELIETNPEIAGLIKEVKKQITSTVHHQNRITNAIETREKAHASITSLGQILKNALTYLNSVEPDTRALVYESIRNQRRQFSKANVVLIRFKNEVKSIFTDLQLDLKIPEMEFGQPADFVLFEFIDDFLLGQAINKSLEGLSVFQQNIDVVLTMLEQKYDEIADQLASLEEMRKGIILNGK